MEKNKVTNVTAGKPKIGGAVFVAPVGSTLPNDATSELDPAFKNLGYASEDGLVNSNTPESETVKAWGGDIVLTTATGKTDTFSLTCIEAMNVEVLKAVYGEENVSGDLESGITIKATSEEIPPLAWVYDMILRGGIPKRVVIPSGRISEIGEVSYTDSGAVGYPLTINAEPDTEGVTHYEYIGTTV